MDNLSSVSSNPFVCSVVGCGQTFRRKDYLRRHEGMHANKRPFGCDLCGKAFGRSDVLTRHRKKCPAAGLLDDQASLQPRSTSTSSPQHRDEILERPSINSEQHAFSRLISYQGDVETRLPFVPDTRSLRRRRAKHIEGIRGSDDSASDVSAESLALQARSESPEGRTGRSKRSNGPSGQNATVGEYTKRARRMPILDIDFPVGYGEEHDGVAATKLSRAAVQLPEIHVSTSIIMSAPAAPQVGDSPLEWLQDTGGGWRSTDMSIPSSSFESYLPDTSFDFESFFLSTLGPNHPDGQISSSSMFNVPTSTSSSLQDIARASGSRMVDDLSIPSTSAETLILRSIGPAPQHTSIYHVPVDRFKAYYQRTHWSLPPLLELSSFAERAKTEILPHVGFLHAPTFRLDMLATCLAFTLCVVGADVTKRREGIGLNDRDPLSGRWGPGQMGITDPAQDRVWDLGPMVRNEMTIMIMKSFSVTKKMTMSDYNLALNQSLLLLQALEILSDQPHQRMRANMFRTTIVNTARQLECYNPKSSHFRSEIRLPVQPWTFSELDLHWRRWIQLEVRRRTTYFIYIFDMLATIETSIPCCCSPMEVVSIPLPAPVSLWEAEGAECWLRAARTTKPVSLDDALRDLFTGGRAMQEGSGPFAHSKSDALGGLNLGPNASSTSTVSLFLDRFALHVIMLTLLRGVIEIGEGRRERGDWYDLTDLWLERKEADGWILSAFARPAGRAAILEVYLAAVSQWKSWWDELPPTASDQARPIGQPQLCEEALPSFWLVQALLGVLASSSPIEVRRAFITRINFAEMLNSARAFTRTNPDGFGFPDSSFSGHAGNGTL